MNEDGALISAIEREAAVTEAPATASLLCYLAGLSHERRGNLTAALANYRLAVARSPQLRAPLRRARAILSAQGQRDEVIALLDIEIQHTEERETCAGLMAQQARLLLDAKEVGRAGERAKEALDKHRPEALGTLATLEEVFVATDQHAALATTYEAIASQVFDARAKASYLTLAGLLHEHRLGSPEDSARLYRKAFKYDRRDPLLLDAMKRLGETSGAPIETLRALAAEANVAGSSASAMYLEIFHAYQRLQRPDDALAALQTAHKAAPLDPLILEELASLYEQNGSTEAQLSSLETWEAVCTAPGEIARVNLKLGEVLEGLGRDDDAAMRYHRILTEVPPQLPGHQQAVSNLGRLYHRTEQWVGLFRSFVMEAEHSIDPLHKAFKLYKAGETLAQKLFADSEAEGYFRQALDVSPGYQPAARALRAHFEKHGRWEDLVALRRNDLESMSGELDRIALLTEIASVYESKLGDLPKAIASLEEIAQVHMQHRPTLESLARLYEATERWADVVHVHRRLEQLASDSSNILTLAHRTAEIIDEHLASPEEAIVAWERVLALAPHSASALQALGRLYQQQSSFHKLAAMYEQQARLALDPHHRAQLLFRAGVIYADVLKESEQARRLLNESLVTLPRFERAQRLLERLLQESGEFEKLAKLLIDAAANEDAPLPKANYHFRAAVIFESCLDHQAEAVEHYEAALTVYPLHTAALLKLERLRQQDSVALLEVYQRQGKLGDTVASSAMLKTAHLALERLEDRSRAATAASDALMLDPTCLTALKLLERADASSVSAAQRDAVGHGLGDKALAATICGKRSLNREVPLTPPEFIVQQLEFVSQDLSESHDLNRFLAAAEASLELVPNLFPALYAKGSIASRQGDYAAARKSFEDIANTCRDSTNRHRALLRAARIAERHQGDVAAARALVGTIVEEEPLHGEATHLLATIDAREQGADAMLALYERWAKEQLALGEQVFASLVLIDAAHAVYGYPDRRPRALALLEQARTLHPKPGLISELIGDIYADAADTANAESNYTRALSESGARAIHIELKLSHLPIARYRDAERATKHLQQAIRAIDATTPISLAITIHAEMVALAPTNISSIRALYNLRRESGYSFAAYSAAAVLKYFGVATSEELACYEAGLLHAAPEITRQLDHEELALLIHPLARRSLLDVLLRVIGDELPALYPKMKAEHTSLPSQLILNPSWRTSLETTRIALNLQNYRILQSFQGLVSPIFASTPSIALEPDLGSKLSTVQVAFLLARALYLSAGRLAGIEVLGSKAFESLLGSVLRAVDPAFSAFGDSDEASSRAAVRVIPQKAVKQLVWVASKYPKDAPLQPVFQGHLFTADRAGLLITGDPYSALSAMHTMSALRSPAALDPKEVVTIVEESPVLQALVRYALSYDYVQLRSRFGPLFFAHDASRR